MDINTVGPAASWRLVHDGHKVISLLNTGGITRSINMIFESGDKAGCEIEITRLNLQYNPQDFLEEV